MKVPEGKTITLTFVSHPTKSLKMRWWGRLTFPGGAGADALLPVAVTDGEERPVKAGTLDLFGAHIKIRNGRGALASADFIKGKHDAAIWLHRRGMLPIPGGLTFA